MLDYLLMIFTVAKNFYEYWLLYLWLLEVAYFIETFMYSGAGFLVKKKNQFLDSQEKD